jgi:hypothetical protein
MEEEIVDKGNDNTTADQHVSPGIVKGKDGVLRWVYEMNMWKNPTLIITIWNILLLVALFPAILMFLLSLGDGIGSAFVTMLKIYIMVAVIITVLMLLAYLVVVLVNGGQYCVLFEMDKNGVKHIQMHKQYKRNQVLSMITVLAGIATGNVQTTAAGVMAGTKQSIYSEFDKVKEVKIRQKRNVIFLNQNFSHNQVYANNEDFLYVSDFIIKQCRKAKVTRK